MQIEDELILKEFKKVIVPGVFGVSFANVNIVEAGTLFVKYLNDIEKKGFINRDQAIRLEFKFVRIIQKRGI